MKTISEFAHDAMNSVSTKHKYTINWRTMNNRITFSYVYKGPRFGDLEKKYGSYIDHADNASYINGSKKTFTTYYVVDKASYNSAICCFMLLCPILVIPFCLCCPDQLKKETGMSTEEEVIRGIQNLIREGDQWIDEALYGHSVSKTSADPRMFAQQQERRQPDKATPLQLEEAEQFFGGKQRKVVINPIIDLQGKPTMKLDEECEELHLKHLNTLITHYGENSPKLLEAYNTMRSLYFPLSKTSNNPNNEYAEKEKFYLQKIDQIKREETGQHEPKISESSEPSVRTPLLYPVKK